MTQDDEIASPRRPACGMCGNRPCTCGSGRVEHVAVPVAYLRELHAKAAELERLLATVPLAPDQGGGK